MKTRIRDRILMPIAGLVLLLGAAAATAQVFFGRNATGAAAWLLAREGTLWKVIYGVAIAALVLLGLYCISFLFRRNKSKGMIRQKRDGGNLTISVKALECLVERCLETHKELKRSRIRIVGERDGIVILVQGSMRMGTNVPMATDMLQKQTREYLTDCTGIDVKAVNLEITGMHEEEEVSVYSVPDPVDPLSERARPTESAEQPGEEERPPLHQRIFGHKEQPMDMPEPAPETVEAPAGETSAEEAPAEEAPVEEAPVEEATPEEAPAEEVTVEEVTAEEASAEETAAEEISAEEKTVEAASAGEPGEGETEPGTPGEELRADAGEKAAEDGETRFPFLEVMDEAQQS